MSNRRRIRPRFSVDARFIDADTFLAALAVDDDDHDCPFCRAAGIRVTESGEIVRSHAS